MKVSIVYTKKSQDTVKVSVEQRDLWDASLTLARVIYPVLKKYRKLYDDEKNGYMGYPMDFAQDPTKREGPDNQDRFEDWLKCLDTMIYSFEWIAKHQDWDGPTTSAYYKTCQKLLTPHKKELKKLKQEDTRRFAQAEAHTALASLEWNRRSEITRPAFELFMKEADEHHKKVQEGIDLFAKYFGALWS